MIGPIKMILTRRAYRELFLDEHGQLKAAGRIVLDDLYEHARLFKNVPADPMALALVEGGRDLVRRILRQIKAVDVETKRQVHQGVYGDE